MNRPGKPKLTLREYEPQKRTVCVIAGNHKEYTFFLQFPYIHMWFEFGHAGHVFTKTPLRVFMSLESLQKDRLKPMLMFRPPLPNLTYGMCVANRADLEVKRGPHHGPAVVNLDGTATRLTTQDLYTFKSADEIASFFWMSSFVFDDSEPDEALYLSKLERWQKFGVDPNVFVPAWERSLFRAIQSIYKVDIPIFDGE